MNKFKIWWLALFLFVPITAFAQDIELNEIRIIKAEPATRLILELSARPPYRIFTLSNPDRVVLDLQETHRNASLANLNFTGTNILRIRSGHPREHTLRLVLDISGPAHFKILTGPEDQRLVLDIMAAENKIVSQSTEKTIHETTTQTDENTNKEITQTTVIKTVKKSSPGIHTMVVVIDPGHGGKDPGTIGKLGTKEKNVVLSIGKKLAALINAQPHMHAVLTRNGDYFVRLRNRIHLAHKGKADLFIALHADSYFNDNSTGASVYTLSQRGATSEAARWLAKRDNTSELGDVALGKLGDQSYILRSVLLDLAQTVTTSDSIRLGGSLLDSLHEVTRLHYARVEQAPFVVLKSPDIPSALVEMGFLSNESEERKLRNPDYQHKMARALFQGIRQYYSKNSGSYV